MCCWFSSVHVYATSKCPFAVLVLFGDTALTVVLLSSCYVGLSHIIILWHLKLTMVVGIVDYSSYSQSIL